MVLRKCTRSLGFANNDHVHPPTSRGYRCHCLLSTVLRFLPADEPSEQTSNTDNLDDSIGHPWCSSDVLWCVMDSYVAPVMIWKGDLDLDLDVDCAQEVSRTADGTPFIPV